MKKITLLMTLLFITVYGFSQELVTNGDFETGMAAPWFGNSANPQDDGSGNFVNEANIIAAGTPFSANLSQEIVLVSGRSYELTFDAYTDATTETRSIVVGLGQNGAPFSAELISPNPVLTATPQTFTQILTINYGDAVPDRVIFDMGAETGFVFIDNVSVQETVDLCNDGELNNGETEVDCGGPNCDACPSPPMVAAPTPPARDAANVVSIFSDAYAEIPGINFDAGFCGPNAVTATTAGGDPIFAYTGQACQGIDFSGSPQDITGFTNIHVDLFIEAGTDLIGKVFNILVVHPDGLGDTPVNIDLNAVTPAPVPGTWFSFDRVVTFNNPTVRQVTVVSNLNNDVWYDNLYIHNNVVLSTNDFETAQFTVAPNPTKDVWTIESNNTIDTIEVFDILGKSVITLNPNNQNASIEASGLKTGIYLAKLYSNGGFKTVRLVKN